MANEYGTQVTIKARLTVASDDTDHDAVVDAVNKSASRRIDNKLKKAGITTPITSSVPEPIIAIAEDMAVALYALNPGNGTNDADRRSAEFLLTTADEALDDYISAASPKATDSTKGFKRGNQPWKSTSTLRHWP